MSESETSIAALLERALDAFESGFGRPATLAAAAPGRVNLMGEHTDYNDGYVLPIAIDRWAVIVGDVAPETESISTWYSLDLDEEYEADLQQPLQPVTLDWVNYPLGVVEEFRQHQIELPNIDFVLTSSVPIGAGLSSSAAITVALATMFAEALGFDLDPIRKAQWCQRAEHEFPKVPCGIMDPMIASLASEGDALFIDCQSHETKRVTMPPQDDAVLLIANTNVKHALATSEYAARREECRLAVEELRAVLFRQEIQSLRDVTANDLRQARDQMDPVFMRRAMHVVNENIRTLESIRALMQHDLQRFGEYMFASHVSLRDEYEVSCAELDTLVELAGELSLAIAGQDRGVYGARMTGAGFGGCAIILCRPDAVDLVTQYLVDGHLAKFDTAPTIFASHAVAGARAITVASEE